MFAPPAPGEHACRSSACTLAFARSRHASCARRTSRIAPVDVYDATAVARARSRRSSGSPTGGSRPRAPPGFHPDARGAASSSTAPRSAAVGEVDADVVDALALVAPVVACEIDVDALLAGARVTAHGAPGLALPGVDDRPRVRRRRRPFPPAAIAGARCATRAASSSSASRSSTCSAPTRSARARSASRSRCGSGRPTARSPTTRSSELRQAVHRRGRVGARRRAAELRAERRVAFTHRIRVRYAEIDGQGVVFNAHWLTYFDDSCTRFMESLGLRARLLDQSSST